MRSTWYLCAALLGVSAAAQAGVIVQNTLGGTPNTAGFYYGQSFTTAAGYGWDHIIFSFLNDTPAEFAIGTGYLFTQEYLGLPGGLPGGSGLLGAAVSSGGQYAFHPLVTLAGSAMYYFYTDSGAGGGSFSGGAVAPGGSLYFATSGIGNFTLNEVSTNYRVSADVAPVPEPGTMAMFALGAGSLLALIRHRRAL